MSQTSPLDASINLAFEAAATGSQVLRVDADTYGGAVAHANIKNAIGRQGRRERTGTGKTTLVIFS